MMFNKLTREDFQKLESMLPGRVLDGKSINEDYYHDELGTAFGVPEVLVKVLSTEDVASVMKLAYESNIPVVVRGSGTGLVGGAVAINGGTMMSWDWVMTSVEPERKDLIVLSAGEELILIGRGKVTDYPYQLHADTAMTGAVNFTDFGLYITGKVFSDHNNTRCY